MQLDGEDAMRSAAGGVHIGGRGLPMHKTWRSAAAELPAVEKPGVSVEMTGFGWENL